MLLLLVVCRAALRFVSLWMRFCAALFHNFNCLAAGIRWHAKGDRDDTRITIHTQTISSRTRETTAAAHNFSAMLTLTRTNSNGVCTRQRVIETPACQRCVRCVKIDMRVDSIVENEQRVTVRLCVRMNDEKRHKNRTELCTAWVRNFCFSLLFWSSQVFLSEVLHASIHFIWNMLTRANCCLYTSII